jgi:outer membrane protein OmpA-like peptidoglycan-associated protein
MSGPTCFVSSRLVSSSLLNSRKALIAAAVAAVLLAACTAAPVKPDGAAQARNKLTQLQADPDLVNRAPVAIKEADAAVAVAEQPEPDAALAAHRVYLADRKVDTARALAETRLAEDQRVSLSAQRESARLDARTREADAAKGQIASARSDANAAQLAANNSEQQSAELQRQIDVLQAKATDRGLVLTLGDMLFATGRADLMPAASGNLNKLVVFLGKYPQRTVAIEGFTDSVGTDGYNQGLSERRADSVKAYLVRQGVETIRLSASGRGKDDPIADNGSAAGRQLNRRVEVIINNPASALR